MLDFTKIKFNELDNDNPLQAFYEYDLTQSEINQFMKEYATCDEVPEGVSIQKIELCLTIYSHHDFKLEACCTDAVNEQYWVMINEHFTNAADFIQLIPDYGKITKETIVNESAIVNRNWVRPNTPYTDDKKELAVDSVEFEVKHRGIERLEWNIEHDTEYIMCFVHFNHLTKAHKGIYFSVWDTSGTEDSPIKVELSKKEEDILYVWALNKLNE